jgi:hypothetical protein
VSGSSRAGVSRRAVLRGAGVALTLPFLESLAPRTARAADVPLRFLAYYVPNGHWMDSYKMPAGSLAKLSETLSPLAPLSNKLLVLQGLDRAYGKTVAGHASGTTSFLTCTQAKTTQGADVLAGISIDQLMAPVLGAGGRFPSLQLGIDGGIPSLGNCDTGFACAYTRTVSWSSATTPMNKLTRADAVFTYLFGDSDPAATAAEQQKRTAYNKSILDAVLGQVQTLSGQLGSSDKPVLEAYMTNLRQVETQLAAINGASCAAKLPDSLPPQPSLQQELGVFFDLMVLALQCDLTRVATFMYGNGLSLRSYGFLDDGTFSPRAHHEISHHGGDAANYNLLKVIDKFEIEQFATFLQKMDSVVEGNGKTLLDNSLVLYGNELADANAHERSNIPCMVAGGGGRLSMGRALDYGSKPMANLHIALLQLLRVRLGEDGKPAPDGTQDIQSFGIDGTAPLDELT